MTALRWQLRDFGQEPDEPVLDLVGALANGGPPGPAALALVERAARGEADRGIIRLLPMLFDHPAARSLPGPTMESIRRSSHRTRARFLALEATAQRIVEALAREGIPVIFLKGFALACGVYASPAHRPMGDLDLAVPHQRHADAGRLLEAIGFSPLAQDTSRGTLIAGVSAHALAFRNDQARVSLDLHYNILNCSLWEEADDGFWREAEPLRRDGFAPALTLAPEHHVVHACVHGYCRSLLQLSIRWMIDTHLLLTRAPNDFRWDLVEEEARRHRCGPLVAAALGYLADKVGSPVPAERLERLASQPMPGFDRAYFRDVGRLQEKGSAWLRLCIAWNSCQRQAGRHFWTPLPFARQMARRWGVTSPIRLATSALHHLQEPRFMRAKRSLATPGTGSAGEGRE